MTAKYQVNQEPYKLKSVVASDPPPGVDGNNWFHYSIAQGKNVIKGYRQGQLESIYNDLTENVEALNARQKGKCGRVDLIASKKPSAKK